jgi:hypothetical protein
MRGGRPGITTKVSRLNYLWGLSELGSLAVANQTGDFRVLVLRFSVPPRRQGQTWAWDHHGSIRRPIARLKAYPTIRHGS